ncbi:hypothetical protein UFOVP1151_28 [uncultured Caudovirales phage]|uniref:Tail fiber protein n=1 Tax=uncultured Caudovirales phage TaxID=2100421 RepID=A0A6J5QQ75_9CAUD|nr:hypothetical protein UFOVP1151_28 [uncultured Caudovirales phage]
MAQISKGDTFTNGEQVTGARLNQLVDSSVLLVGAITDQPSITANTLEATDTTIVNDAGTLKEATIGDFLNSNLAITTSSITGGAGVDIIVTPAATKKFDVNGALEAESINTIGAVAIGGAATVTGTLGVTGATTLTGGISGNTTVNGNLTIGSGKTLTLDTDPTTNLQAATKAYVDSGSKAACKAWVKFAGATGTVTASYNVTSVTRTTTGTYTVNITTALADANFAVISNCSNATGIGAGWVTITGQTTSSASLYSVYPVSYGGAFINFDPTSVYVAIFGN